MKKLETIKIGDHVFRMDWSKLISMELNRIRSPYRIYFRETNIATHEIVFLMRHLYFFKRRKRYEFTGTQDCVDELLDQLTLKWDNYYGK